MVGAAAAMSESKREIHGEYLCSSAARKAVGNTSGRRVKGKKTDQMEHHPLKLLTYTTQRKPVESPRLYAKISAM